MKYKLNESVNNDDDDVEKDKLNESVNNDDDDVEKDKLNESVNNDDDDVEKDKLNESVNNDENIVIMSIKDWGLASFMMEKGCPLSGISPEGNCLLLSPKQYVSKWAILYANSCCKKHLERVKYIRNLIYTMKKP